MQKTNQQSHASPKSADRRTAARKLLIVPILHTKEDMGTLGRRLPKQDGYFPMVSAFWQEVKEKVKKYTRDFSKVKVYQDGLPNTDRKLIERIIDEVKSPNYDLLRFLKNKGAQILGTEDPKLLKKEYQLISQILKAKGEETKSKMKRVYEKHASQLLAKRDAYIAKQIDKTLQSGYLGILFLGAAHDILSKLAKDIQAEVL